MRGSRKGRVWTKVQALFLRENLTKSGGSSCCAIAAVKSQLLYKFDVQDAAVWSKFGQGR